MELGIGPKTLLRHRKSRKQIQIGGNSAEKSTKFIAAVAEMYFLAEK